MAQNGADELSILSSPQRLVQGLTVYEKNARRGEKGRVIFSLKDLPLRVDFVTELGNSLRRDSELEVLYQGIKKLSVKEPRDELLGKLATKPQPPALSPASRSPASPAAAASQTSESESAATDPEAEKRTKQMVKEAESTARQDREILTRMVSKVQETRTTAANTMQRLNEQGEQIQRVQDNLDSMQGNFDQADRELRSINSIFGQMANAMVPASKKTYDTNQIVNKDEEKKRAELDKKNLKVDKKEQKKEAKRQKEFAKRGIDPNQSNLPPELQVLSPQAQQDVHDTDKMLNVVGDQLAELKQMARSMGDEIELQNNRLDHLTTSVDKTDTRLKATSHKVRKQLD